MALTVMKRLIDGGYTQKLYDKVGAPLERFTNATVAAVTTAQGYLAANPRVQQAVTTAQEYLAASPRVQRAVEQAHRFQTGVQEMTEAVKARLPKNKEFIQLQQVNAQIADKQAMLDNSQHPSFVERVGIVNETIAKDNACLERIQQRLAEIDGSSTFSKGLLSQAKEAKKPEIVALLTGERQGLQKEKIALQAKTVAGRVQLTTRKETLKHRQQEYGASNVKNAKGVVADTLKRVGRDHPDYKKAIEKRDAYEAELKLVREALKLPVPKTAETTVREEIQEEIRGLTTQRDDLALRAGVDERQLGYMALAGAVIVASVVGPRLSNAADEKEL
ncbi:MAG: hypothetical protein KGZ39_05970 [Simkania sp.]|nr:hypothetical protein [Simkania sp.]